MTYGQPLSIADEAALLTTAQGGERVDVDALVRYLTPHIHKRAAYELLRRGRGPRRIRQEVEDVVHEVWARLLESEWRVLRRWDPARNVSLRSFVGLVTVHHIIDIQRSGRKTPFREQSTLPEDLEREGALVDGLEQRLEHRSFLVHVVSRLKARLSPAARDVFDVMYLEGAEVAEAAARTGLTTSSVYSHRKRISKAAVEVARELGVHGG